MPMPLDEKAKRNILSLIDYLEQRWQDEQNYEDWSDYYTAMKRKLEQVGLIFKSAGRKPFGCIGITPDGQLAYHFMIKDNKQQVDTYEYKVKEKRRA